MTEVDQAEIKARIEAALGSFVDKIKADPNILAVILMGSLANDMVWVKNDMDTVVYILDEPTTGLHVADIEKLLVSINKLVDSGHSVLVIEHNLDVIKSADYVIDLGPEGGDEGGEIVAHGTPEEIAKCGNSYTGKFLAKELRLHD